MSTNETRKGRVTFETPEPSSLSAVTLPLGQLCSHVWSTLPLYIKGGTGPTRHVSLPPHPNVESPIVLDDSEGCVSQEATGLCIRRAAEGFGRMNAYTSPITVGLLRSSVLKAAVVAQRSNIAAYLASVAGDNSPRNIPTLDESPEYLVRLDPRLEKDKLWCHIDGALASNEVAEGKGRQQQVSAIPPLSQAFEEQIKALVAKSAHGYNDQQLTLLAAATNIVALVPTRDSASAGMERVLFYILQELNGGSQGEGFLQRVVVPILHLIPLIGGGCQGQLVDIGSYLREISACPSIPKDTPAILQTSHFVEKVRVDSTNGARWESTIKFPYAKRLVVNVERCDAPNYFACGHVGADGFTPLKLEPDTQQSFPAGTLLFKHSCDNQAHPPMGSPSPSNESLDGSPGDWGSTLFDRPPSAEAQLFQTADALPEHALIATIKAEVQLEVDTNWQRELRHAVIDGLIFVGGQLLQNRNNDGASWIASPLCRGGLGSVEFSAGSAILATPDEEFALKARCRRSEVTSKKPILAVAAHHLVTDVSNMDDLWRHPMWRDLSNRASIRPILAPLGVVDPDFSASQVADHMCRTILPLSLHAQSIHTTSQIIEWSERLLAAQTSTTSMAELIAKRGVMYERSRTGLTLLHTALDLSDIPPASLDRLISVLRDFLASGDRHYLSVLHGCGAEKEDNARQMVLEALRKLFTLNRMQRRQADTVSSHRYLRTELRHGTSTLGMVSLLSAPLDQWDLAGLCKPYGRQKFTLVRELAEMLPKFGEFARSQSFSLSNPVEEAATQSLLEGLVNIWANPESARGTRGGRGDAAQEKIEVSFNEKLFHHYPTPFVHATRVFGYAEITIKSDAPMIVALLPPQAANAYADGKSVGSFAEDNRSKCHYYDVSGKASSPNKQYVVPPLFSSDVLGVAYSIEGTTPVVHYFVNSLKVLTVPLALDVDADQLYISVLSQRRCRGRATIRFTAPFKKNDPTELNPCSRHRPTQHLVSAFALTVMHIIMDRAARYSIHDAKHNPNRQVIEALTSVLALGEGVVSESIEGICDAATSLLEEAPVEATERVKVNTAITVYDRMLYSLLCIAKVVVAGATLCRQGITQPPARLIRAIVHLLLQPSGLKRLLSCEAAAHILGVSLRNGILGSEMGAPIESLTTQQHSAIQMAISKSLPNNRFVTQFDTTGSSLTLSSHGLRIGSVDGVGAATTSDRIHLHPDQSSHHTFSVLFQRRGGSLGGRTVVGVCHSAVLDETDRRNYWNTIQSKAESFFVVPVAATLGQQSIFGGLKCPSFNFAEAFQNTSSWSREGLEVFAPDDIVTVSVGVEGGVATVVFTRNGLSLGALYNFQVTAPMDISPFVGLHEKDIAAVLVSPLCIDRHEHRMMMFMRELAAASPTEICTLEPIMQRTLLRGLGSDGDPSRLSWQTQKERRQPTAVVGGRVPAEVFLRHQAQAAQAQNAAQVQAQRHALHHAQLQAHHELLGAGIPVDVLRRVQAGGGQTPDAVLNHLMGMLAGARGEAAPPPSTTKSCTLIQFNDSSATAEVSIGKGKGPVRQQTVPVSQLRCNVSSSLFIDTELSGLGVASLVRFICSRVFSDERGKVSLEDAGLVSRALRVLRALLFTGPSLSTTNPTTDRADTSVFECCTIDEIRDFYEVLQLLGSISYATSTQPWTAREKDDALISTNWKDIGTTVAFSWCVIDALPHIVSYECASDMPCYDIPRQAVRIQTASEIQRENFAFLQEMTSYVQPVEGRAEGSEETVVPQKGLHGLVCHQCGMSPWTPSDQCTHPIPSTSMDVLSGIRTRSGASAITHILSEVWKKDGYTLTFSSISTLEAVSGVGSDTHGTFDFSGSFCGGWVLSLRTQYRHIDCSVAEAEQEEDNEQWSCDVCTFLNDNTSARCGMCSTSRPGAAWSCGECTYAFNSTATTRCEMCGTSRPGAQTADPTSQHSAACSLCKTAVAYTKFNEFVSPRHCEVCGILAEFLPTVPVKGSIEGVMQMTGASITCKWVADTSNAFVEDVHLERSSGCAQASDTEKIEIKKCLSPLPPASAAVPRVRLTHETSSLAQALVFFASSIFPYVVSAVPEGNTLHEDEGASSISNASSIAQVVSSSTCIDPFWTNNLAGVLPDSVKEGLLRSCLDTLATTPSVGLSRLAASLVPAVPTALNVTLYGLAHIALTTSSQLRRDAVVDTLSKVLDASTEAPNLSILSKLMLIQPRTLGIQRLMVLVATRGGTVLFETAAPVCLTLALVCETAMSNVKPLPLVVDAPVTSLTHRLIPMPNTTMRGDTGLVVGQVRGSSAADPRKGGKFYYEVVVPAEGMGNAIYMGWGTREHEQQSSFHHVGADNHSVAFDLRSILHVMGGGQEYHPPRRIRGGDVVGALLDVDINQMCWSLNGEEIGMWMMVPLPTVEPLFPFVSARVDEKLAVEVKLGNTQFCPDGFTDFTVCVTEKTFVDRSPVAPESLQFYEQLSHWANDLCTLGIRLDDIRGGDTKWEGRGRTQLALYSLVADKVQEANGSLSALQPYLQHLDSLSDLALSAASLESSVRSLDNCAASCARVKKLLLFAARWGVIERVLVSAMDRDARAFAATVDMALAKQPHTETIAILQNSIVGQLYAATNDENIFKRRNMLTIKLNGSISEDGGGILRTVLSLLSEEMMFTFNPTTSEREAPKLPLFRCNDHSSIFNVLPSTEPLHGPHAELCQSMLRWVGKVMGNAALTGRIMLAVSLPKIFWMKLVDDTPTIEDLFYDCNDTCKKSLEDPDLLLSDMYFDVFPFVDATSLQQARGDEEKVPSSPLTGPPGGMFIMPSSDDLVVIGQSRTKNQQKVLNRRREAASNALLTEFDEAIGYIKEGIESVVPPAALAEMHWDDLRRRVTGSSTQTPADLLREMDMGGLSDRVQIMLTEAIESLPPDLCSRLLLFCTGQSRLPLPEKIKVVELDEPTKVPSSHTCSPITLTVHDYRDSEEMKSKLLTAISNAYEFGFV